MTANKNEPEKKPAGSTSAQAGARPHATIDLKATEVTPPSTSGDKDKAQKDKPAVAEASKPTPSAASAASSSTSAAAASAAAAKATPGPTAAAGAKSDKPGSTTPPASQARPAARGYGGFF